MDSILYESYAQPTKRSFARAKDTEKPLTISLAAGKGTVVNAYALEPGTVTKVTKRYPKQLFDLFIQIKNDGDTDIIWFTAKDQDTGAIIKTKAGIPISYSTSLGAGKMLSYTWPKVEMPNKVFKILVAAGHGE